MDQETQTLGAFPSQVTASRYHDFSYGHVVLNHESKCANMHGHNGRVHFTCVAPQLDTVGRVIDFSVIKARLCMWVEENWDHKFLISQDHPWASQLPHLDPTVVVTNFNPTAENLAAYLLHVIGPLQLKGTDVVLTDVQFEETRKCTAGVSLPWRPKQLGEKAFFANYGGSSDEED